MRSNVRIVSSPYMHGWIEFTNYVTLASIISDVIYGFYLSMLRRRHFQYIEAHREEATLLHNLELNWVDLVQCPSLQPVYKRRSGLTKCTRFSYFSLVIKSIILFLYLHWLILMIYNLKMRNNWSQKILLLLLLLLPLPRLLNLNLIHYQS